MLVPLSIQKAKTENDSAAVFFFAARCVIQLVATISVETAVKQWHGTANSGRCYVSGLMLTVSSGLLSIETHRAIHSSSCASEANFSLRECYLMLTARVFRSAEH